ncbi:MAG: VWA-like domain-containing protein [Lachnospiraceae bacterium]|nr:VWA-like domain-containing protein [Lachnospiraceae bacterium]
MKNGFYGIILMRLYISLSERHKTAWVEDGVRVFINPEFVESVSDRELEYVFLHILLHIVLGHNERGKDFDKNLFDKAADIVVNSNIYVSEKYDENSIYLEKYGGVQPHFAPNGREGYYYSTEEVYRLIVDDMGRERDGTADFDDSEQNSESNIEDKDDGDTRRYEIGGKKDRDIGEYTWDIHEELNPYDRNWFNYQFREYVTEAIDESMEMYNGEEYEKMMGSIPGPVIRAINMIRKPQTNWRKVLNDFIQEDFVDYSFMPPDRRYGEIPFFLPGYTEKAEKVENILFMVDASGSMKRKDIEAAYSEVKGAIDQFNGRIKGWIGFFDCFVTKVKPFSDEEDFLKIIPWGGGGTRFDIIFEYVHSSMADNLPESIVILTDGEADYPDELEAEGIPVLWMMTTDKEPPSWGRSTRIVV